MSYNFDAAEGGGKIIPDRKEDRELLEILEEIRTWQPINKELEQRLLLLNMRSMTDKEFNHERDTHLKHSLEVYKYCERMVSCLSELEKYKKEIKLAALLHDIGKTGPDFDKNFYSNEEQQVGWACMRLFSLTESNDEVGIVNKTIKEILEKHATLEDQKNIFANLSALGLSSENTMREFYNSHLNNTIDILRNNQIPEPIVWIAGHHHNYGKLHKYSEKIDDKDLEKLNLASKMLQIVDSFEAAKSRGGMKNEENIERLLNNYSDDVEAKEIIQNLKLVI